MIEEMEKMARGMLSVILSRATEIRHTLPCPDVWPVDYFPGKWRGCSRMISMDDGMDTFKAHLLKAVEQTAQEVAHIQMDHGFCELTVKYKRCDGEFSKSCLYDCVIEWFPRPGAGGVDLDDSDEADWWKQ